MAVNDKRPRSGVPRTRKSDGSKPSEVGTKSKNRLQTVSTSNKNGSSTNLKAASSSRLAKTGSASAPGAGNIKNALGSRSQSTEVQGFSIAFRMAIIFGALIAVMVLVSLLALNTFVEGKLKDEVKASGVKSSVLLSMTGQLIAKFKEVMDREGLSNNIKADLNNDYKRIALDLNRKDVNILCISIRDPSDRLKAIFTSYTGQYSEVGFNDSRIETISDVEIKTGWFKQSTESGVEEIPAFKFESKIIDKTKLTEPSKGVVGYAVIFISFQNVKEATSRIQKITFVVAAFGAIIGLGVSWMFARTLSDPLLRLVRDIQIVAEGDLDHKTKSRSRDEIGVLANTFNKMTENLRYQRDLEADVVTRDIELGHAKEIQQRLLPRDIPNLKGFEFFQIYISAKEVGGDYYDIMRVDDSNIALLVADVSGKGIPGSMVMAETRTILRIIRHKVLSTKKIMSYANRLLAEDIKPGMFVTMMYCILNLEDKTMLVSSAGHNPLMIQRASGEFLKVNPKGIALGFDKGPIFDRVIAEQKIQLMPGDRVVLYTDGVVESMNIDREEYGDDRLEEYIQKNSKLSSKAFVDKLMADVSSHQGDAEQHDDITILTFKVL
jgi:serine phosphatase RsbU (regulator of sigma subunit)